MENVSVCSPEAYACSASLFAPVERVASRSCAVVRRTRTVFPSVPSCEWYLGHCAVDLLCDAHDDSSSMALENCSCTVVSIHCITQKNWIFLSKLRSVWSTEVKFSSVEWWSLLLPFSGAAFPPLPRGWGCLASSSFWSCCLPLPPLGGLAPRK